MRDMDLPTIPGDYYSPFGPSGDFFRSVEQLPKALEKHGVHLKPGSRFVRLKAVLENMRDARVSDLGENELYFLLHGMQEMRYLRTILSAFSKPTDYLRQRLEHLVSGAELAVLDKGNTAQARNYQFELYSVAMFHHAGFSVQLCEPPDGMLVDHGQQFGIAAKRVSSDSKVQRNISDGRDQLVAAGVRGYIMMDVTGIVCRDRPFIVAKERGVIDKLVPNRLAAYEGKVKQMLLRKFVDGPVIAVFLFASHPGIAGCRQVSTSGRSGFEVLPGEVPSLHVSFGTRMIYPNRSDEHIINRVSPRYSAAYKEHYLLPEL